MPGNGKEHVAIGKYHFCQKTKWKVILNLLKVQKTGEKRKRERWHCVISATEEATQPKLKSCLWQGCWLPLFRPIRFTPRDCLKLFPLPPPVDCSNSARYHFTISLPILCAYFGAHSTSFAFSLSLMRCRVDQSHCLSLYIKIYKLLLTSESVTLCREAQQQPFIYYYCGRHSTLTGTQQQVNDKESYYVITFTLST